MSKTKVFGNHHDESSIILTDLLFLPDCLFLELRHSAAAKHSAGGSRREVYAAPWPYLGFKSPTSSSFLGRGENPSNTDFFFFFKWKINQHFPSNGNSEHFKCQFRTKFIEDFPENGNTQTVNSSFYLLNTTTPWCTTQCPSTHYFKVIQLCHTLIEIN